MPLASPPKLPNRSPPDALMLVLDEQLKDHHLMTAIAAWYPGAVTHIQTLRPATVVKDDNVTVLLLTAHQPTFITINVDDYWRKISPHSG